jgi:hypothetical protein
MLGISHGTLQNLRITRSLPYPKLGGIMFYKYEDIEKILEAGPETAYEAWGDTSISSDQSI